MTEQRRRYIPSEHMVMIGLATLILLTSMALYLTAPPGKQEAFLGLITLLSGFLFGKFTNGYSRNNERRDPPIDPSPRRRL